MGAWNTCESQLFKALTTTYNLNRGFNIKGEHKASNLRDKWFVNYSAKPYKLLRMWTLGFKPILRLEHEKGENWLFNQRFDFLFICTGSRIQNI